jgi:predicted transcriptional regulator
MDSILTARVDDAVLRRLTLLARRLGTSKKAVLERAIGELADRLELEEKIDLLDHTHGVWKRDEEPKETVSTGKQAFSRSMKRHQK